MNMMYNSLLDVWKYACSNYSGNIAFSDKDEKVRLSYKQAFRLMVSLSSIFKKFGIERFDRVCLFAKNSPYWLVIEQAVIVNGAVCVSKTSEIDINELIYVFENSESSALITDSYDLIKHFQEKYKNSDDMKFILYIGDDANVSFNSNKIYCLKNISENIDLSVDTVCDLKENPADIAYINYTSGTSSMPKGAMLRNGGMAYVVEELQKFSNVKEGKTFIVTFPLSSAGGKSFNLLCFSRGCKLIYTDYKSFYDVIHKYSPEYLHCAPKIIQTMHLKLMTEVKQKGLLFETFFNLALKISLTNLKLKRKNINILKFFDDLAERYLYKQIRNTLVKDETIIFVGSAHLAKPLEDFFSIIRIPLIQHFGLTETTGLDVSNTLESQKEHPYTVGVAFSKTKIKIINPETKEELKPNEVGLITLTGPEILTGYYKNEEATKKALIAPNCLNTGDLGHIDKDGYLTVLSRYDDVIVLSNGYNVYTPLIENEAKDSEFISQIVISGHGKPYLTALIVLNQNEYAAWCAANKIKNKKPNDNEKFKEFLIDDLNEKIKRKTNYKYYEKLKKIYFLNEEFTVQNEMLTSTLKVKHSKVCNKYKAEIDSLYEE